MSTSRLSLSDISRRLEQDASAYGLNVEIVADETPNGEMQDIELLIDGRFDAGLEIAVEPTDRFVEALAEFVQDAVSELLGSRWPRCPSGDSLDVTAYDDDVFWHCPIHGLSWRVGMAPLVA